MSDDISDADLDAIVAAARHRQAVTNLASVQGVKPSDAVIGLNNGPAANLPPDVAMHTPGITNAWAERAKRNAAIENSVPVAQFVAAAPSAHVAAAKDNLPDLAKTGAVADTFQASSAVGSFRRGVVRGLAPAAGGLIAMGAGAEVGGTVGAFGGPIGAGVGALGGGLLGAFGGGALVSTVQDAVLKALPKGVQEFLGQSQGQQAADTVQHPYASFAGELAPGFLFGRPTLRASELAPTAGRLSKLFANPATGAITGATLGGATQASQQVASGEPVDWGKVLLASVAGAAQNKLTGAGEAAAGLGAGATRIPGNLLRIHSFGVDAAQDAARGIVAAGDAAHAGAVQDAIANNPLHKSSPSTMEEFLAQRFEGQTVRVDPNALIDLARQGHEPFPEHAAAIQSAAAEGRGVDIPTSTYLNRTADAPFREELNKSTVLREGGTSIEQVGEHVPAEIGPEVPIEPVKIPEDFTPEEGVRAQSLAASAHQELQRVVKAQYLAPLFKDAETLGMTKGQMERFSAGLEEQITAAQEKLTKKAIDQVKRERGGPYKEKLAQHRAQVEQELAANPAIQAREALQNSKGPLGEPLDKIKLDRADPTNKAAGELGLPNRMFGKNGLSADDAGKLFGFHSGDDLHQALLDLHEDAKARGAASTADHIRALVNEEAHARTQAELGYDLDPESIYQTASESITTPKVEDLLEQELRLFADRVKLPFDKVALKRAVTESFEASDINDALNTHGLERDVYNAGEKAQRALLKGDFVEVFKWRQKQWQLRVRLGLAHEFAREYAAGQRRISKWAANPIIAAEDQETLNIIRSTLKKEGVPISNKDFEDPDTALNGKTLDQFVGELANVGFQPVHAPLTGDLNDTSVHGWRGVDRMLEGLSNLGKAKEELAHAGRRESTQTAVATVRATADSLGRRFFEGKLFSERHAGDRRAKINNLLGRAARGIGAIVTRPELVLHWLDGEKFGPLSRFIVAPLQRAKHTAGDLTQQMADRFDKFLKTQPKGWVKTLDKTVDVPQLTYKFDDKGNPIRRIVTKKQAVVAALHLGTDSGLVKLLKGYGWNEATVRSVLNRVLTKEDWNYVQHILDENEHLWPHIEESSRRVRGLAPKKLEPTPIEVETDGAKRTLRGGYYHITYDGAALGEFRDQNGDLVDQKIPQLQTVDGLFGDENPSALPSDGYTQERTDFAAPVNLNHDTIHLGMDQAIHDLTHRGALIQAQKLLQQSGVRTAIHDVLGPEYNTELNNWLKFIARQRVYDGNSAAWATNMLRGFRYNFTNVQVGWNILTALKHGGIAASHMMTEVGPAAMAQSVADFSRSPKEHDRLLNFVMENSGEVRNVMLNMDRDVRGAIKRNLDKHGKLSAYQQNAFVLFAKMKQFESARLWLAKYRTEMGNEVDHERAVFLADKSVRDTQGAGASVDLPTLWRSGDTFWGETGKLTNMFTSFENTSTNRAWTMLRRQGQINKSFKEGDWQGAGRDFNKQLSSAIGFFLVPILYTAAFDTILGGDGDEFTKELAKNGFKSTIGALPFGGIAADTALQAWTKGHYTPGQSPIAEALAEAVDAGRGVVNLATGEEVPSRWVQHSIDTAGYLTGIPTKPISRAAQYVWDWSQGETEDSSPLDFARGILLGPKPKGH